MCSSSASVEAIRLRALIGPLHNALCNGTFSTWYDANVTEGPRRFDDFVVLSPILGGKGHGVPEMMNAVFHKSGNIRWQAAVVESLAWAAAVGGTRQCPIEWNSPRARFESIAQGDAALPLPRADRRSFLAAALATGAAVAFGPVDRISRAVVSADASVIAIGRGFTIARADAAGLPRRLYAGGAWLVWPALASRCGFKS